MQSPRYVPWDSVQHLHAVHVAPVGCTQNLLGLVHNAQWEGDFDHSYAEAKRN
jgi:hypothetical protein